MVNPTLQALRLVTTEPQLGAPSIELELLNSVTFERHLPLRKIAESAIRLFNEHVHPGSSARVVRETHELSRPNLPSCWALRIGLPQLHPDSLDQLPDFLRDALEPRCDYTSDSIRYHTQHIGGDTLCTLAIQSTGVRRDPKPARQAHFTFRSRLTEPDGFSIDEETGTIIVSRQKVGSNGLKITQTVEGVCSMLGVFPMGLEDPSSLVI